MPQGTVLRPVFFAVLVNDISPTFLDTLMIKYADDITYKIPVLPDGTELGSGLGCLRGGWKYHALGETEFDEAGY